MKILIKVTKDVLRRSMMCGVNDCFIKENCAIAVAVREVFPNAKVCLDLSYNYVSIMTGPYHIKLQNCDSIRLPDNASVFIRKFDSLRTTPLKRLDLPEFSFEIEVPYSVIERIGIGEVYKVLSESKTLELVQF